jgi:hypothetical protein
MSDHQGPIIDPLLARALGVADPPPPSREPGDGWWTAFDKSVLGLFEALGLLYALPYGEDLYHDTPVTDQHLHYLWIGLMFAASGPFVSYITRKVSLRFHSTLSSAAQNFYVWLVLIFIDFCIWRNQ